MLLSIIIGCVLTPTGLDGVWSDQRAGYTDLDSLLDPLLQHHELPSLAAAEVSSDGLLALGAVGHRRRGSPEAVTHDDRYHLGSCTKAMTATLAAILVEEGVIGWDTPMAEVFDETVLHPDYQPVTLRMLLNHRGGTWRRLPAHAAVWRALWMKGDVVRRRRWLAHRVLSVAPESEPGERFRYSNTGYIIAGAVLEQASGESWEELMIDRLFVPLEMDSCGFGAPDNGSLTQPWGHYTFGTAVNGQRRFADNPPAFGPAGTVHCTLPDWGRFISAHLAGARGESDWLQPESFAMLHEPVGNYAMGWGVSLTRNDTVWALQHTGTNTMFPARVRVMPTKDRAWLVVTNQGGALKRTRSVVEAMRER